MNRKLDLHLMQGLKTATQVLQEHFANSAGSSSTSGVDACIPLEGINLGTVAGGLVDKLDELKLQFLAVYSPALYRDEKGLRCSKM